MADFSLPLILALSGVAFLAGLVDAIAGGGGLLQMPALLAVGLPPHVALGTNKGASVFGAVASFRKFWSAGLIEKAWLPLLLAGGFFGSLLGAQAQLYVDSNSLKPLVLALLCVAAIAIALLKPSQNNRPASTAANGLAKATAVSVALGAYDGFFGPGTGTFLIVIFSSVFHFSLARASGNAKAVNLASNLAAVGLFSLRGTIVWKVSLPMAIGQIAGATLGARLAVKKGAPLIRAILLLVVFALVMKIGSDLWRSA